MRPTTSTAVSSSPPAQGERSGLLACSPAGHVPSPACSHARRSSASAAAAGARGCRRACDKAGPAHHVRGLLGSRQNWLIWARRALSAPYPQLSARERATLCDWSRRSPPDRQRAPGRRPRQMAGRGLAQDRAAGKARYTQILAEASSRGSAAGSSYNEVAHTCQTGAFGQMSGRRCFSVRERTTCSIKLWPR